MNTPVINVGILARREIVVALQGRYAMADRLIEADELRFRITPQGKISCGDDILGEVLLRPLDSASRFTLRGVTIGIGFHWQQEQDQTFTGELRIIVDGDNLQVINRLGVEDYLQSVVSSEMNAAAPEEFLKAHAVISRSWALAQMQPEKEVDPYQPATDAEETVNWFDHSAHTLFDVCADDHCQRYQGAACGGGKAAILAVNETRGEVLTFGGKLCDARFSKCCGGITERFSTCWQPVDMPYLQAVTDDADNAAADVSSESDAERWLTADPDAFCANPTPEILATILNNYDRATPHLYRWQVSYTADQLADIIRRRTGLDYGRIIELQPLHRGPSGRIDRLRIVGTHLNRIIGKELEIRRSLSESHLYSSAFVVTPGNRDAEGVPSGWTLRGGGWGHGVGLCQIGAAVMATRGYDYRRILAHYFPGSDLTKIY